ncbi:MAG TPA: hypothetical protein VE398_01385, partial [Acidobacteriota bacterium]|nr:hypothetical protein [Acidobacteriota bacterium]
EYEQQKNAEVLFARTHLELPKELFESIAVIRESRLTELNSQDSIRDRITNLAQSGVEELSIRQSLDRLRGAMEDIGSDRAPTKPYMMALDQVAQLKAEGTALSQRRSEFQDWIEERKRLAEEVERLQREHAAARKTVLTARFREAENRILALENLDHELTSLGAEIEPLRAYAAFPARYLEELHQLVGASSSLDRSLADVRTRLKTVEEQMRRAEQERRQVEAFGSIDAEKVSNWFLQYLSLAVKRDEAQKSLGQIQDEAKALERSLGQLGPALRQADVDWQRKAREAAEEERAASENSTRLGEKIPNLRAQLLLVRARRYRRILSGCAAVGLALLPLVLGQIRGATPLLPALGVSAVFAAVALALFLSCGRLGRDLDRIGREIKSVQEAQVRMREEGKKTGRELQRAYQDLGYSSLEEFLDAAKRAEQCRQQFADLSARAKEKERQRDQFQTECSEFLSRIADALSPVGLSCSPGNIKNQIDVMRASVRRFRELDASWRVLVEQRTSLQAEETRLAEELSAKTARAQAILSEAAVRSLEEFRESCAKHRRGTELIEREASRGREFQRLRGDLTLDGWRQRLREVSEALQQAHDVRGSDDTGSGSGHGDPGDGHSLYLPYMPSVEDAEKYEKEIAGRLASVREAFVMIKERVNQAFQGCRTVSEIEEDLSLAERLVCRLSCNRDALRIASETIQALSREQQEVLAPQLNGSVEQRFLRLCQGRYEEVRIDPEFHIYAREIGTGELRLADNLSRGTQDQLYFALRFGILDLVSSQVEPCPCLLDEPFAAYDRQRIIEAFRILEEEAGRRQLFVFTCREDLRDIAQARGAHIVELTETTATNYPGQHSRNQ